MFSDVNRKVMICVDFVFCVVCLESGFLVLRNVVDLGKFFVFCVRLFKVFFFGIFLWYSLVKYFFF